MVSLGLKGDITDLEGLGSIRFVHYVTIEKTQLQSLEGLTNLVYCEKLVVHDNANLRSLVGTQLSFVEEISLINNSMLSSLEGLEGLGQIHGKCTIQGNEGLQSLRGLHNVAELSESLIVRGNRGLLSLDGVASVVTAWGGVVIEGNERLKTLQGLSRLEVANHVHVISRNRLEVFGGLLSNSSRSFIGGISISEDAWPRCIAPQELRSLSPLLKLYESGALLGSPRMPLGPDHSEEATWRSWLDGACGPDRLACWLGQPCRVSLAGSNFTGEVTVSNTTCGPCWDGDASVEAGAVADLTSSARGLQAGNYSLCRCRQGELGAGPVAHLSLLGPVQGQHFECTRGHECVLPIVGHGLVAGDTVMVMRRCGGVGLPVGRAINDGNRTYRFVDRSAVSAADPSTYALCWVPPPCAAPNGSACAQIDVGTLRIKGPFIRDEGQDAVVGGYLTVANIGDDVDVHDRLRLLWQCGQPGTDGIEAVSNTSMIFALSLDRSRVRARRYRKCWCQPGRAWLSTAVNCTAPEHFLADAGGVQVVCPPQEEPNQAGQCRPCPVGWKKSGAGLEECELEEEYVNGLVSFSVMLFSSLAALLLIINRSLRVDDVSTIGGRTYVKTLRSHGLHMHRRASFAVHIRGTGHPDLDAPGEPFRACRSSAQTLELLTADGQPVGGRLDASKGFVSLPATQALWHFGWPVPTGVSATLVVLAGASSMFFQAVQTDGLRDVAIGAASAVFAALAVRFAVILQPDVSALDRRIQMFRKELARRNPKPVACEKGPHRAVELCQLIRVMEFFQDHIRDRNAYYMDGNIFGPLTKAKRLSYAELVGPRAVEWFVSHYWGDPFQNLCSSLRKHAESVAGAMGTWERVAYWICFLSNNQYQIQHELGSSWSESSFFLAVRSGSCRGACMVLDELALPLTRSWCIFELLETLELEKSNGDFQGPLLCTAGGVLNLGQGSVEVAINLARRIGTLDLESASASCESDKTMINNHVIEQLGSFEAMNRLVRQKMRAIIVTAQDNANKSFDFLYRLLDSGAEHEGKPEVEEEVPLGCLFASCSTADLSKVCAVNI